MVSRVPQTVLLGRQAEDPEEAELEAGLQKGKTLPRESLQDRELLPDPGFLLNPLHKPLQNLLLGPLRGAESPGGSEERSRKGRRLSAMPPFSGNGRRLHG